MARKVGFVCTCVCMSVCGGCRRKAMRDPFFSSLPLPLCPQLLAFCSFNLGVLFPVAVVVPFIFRRLFWELLSGLGQCFHG